MIGVSIYGAVRLLVVAWNIRDRVAEVETYVAIRSAARNIGD